jgi:hypothetical protein
MIALLTLLLTFSSSAFQARACPEGEIGHVFIDNHSIFDPASLPEDDRIRWAYELANRIHMRTREEVIRGELPFQEGDCFDSEVARETARVLREFRFIAGADVFDVPQPDGSTHVVVDTRDEWTTKVALSTRFEDGFRFEGASIAEENFLGRGASVGVFWVDREERRHLGALTEVPRVRGSAWDARASMARTRVGEKITQAVIRPFHGEQTGTAFRQEFLHQRDLFTYVLPRDRSANGDVGSWSHLVIPLREQRIQLGLSHRLGQPGSVWVLGGGLSYENLQVGSPDMAEGILDGNFGDREPAPSALSAAIEPQSGSRRAFRANGMAGLRQLRFVERRGLDTVGGIQDVPLGREVFLTVGRTLGSTGPDRPPDVLARLSLFRGGELGPILSFFTLSAESRREAGRGRTEGWRDGIGEAQTLNYWHPEGPGSPTILFRASAQGGWRTDAPYQLTLGGPDGVRGYSETAVPGARRVILSAEGRWGLPNPLSQLTDLGMTIFGDTGRMWAGDAPYGVSTGWRSTVGAGLRVGFPAGSSSVIRIDVAVPVDGAVARSPVIRVSAREWLGVLDDTRSRQLLRSRRSGLTPDFSSVARERRPPG